MNYQNAACLAEEQESTENNTLQKMEKCFIQDFKRRQQFWGSEQMVQYVQKKWLFPLADDEKRIASADTFRRVQAICGAAYRTKIPLNPYGLWYVQSQAERGGATALSEYMEGQYEKFKKVHVWLKCSPIAHIKRLLLPRI